MADKPKKKSKRETAAERSERNDRHWVKRYQDLGLLTRGAAMTLIKDCIHCGGVARFVSNFHGDPYREEPRKSAVICTNCKRYKAIVGGRDAQELDQWRDNIFIWNLDHYIGDQPINTPPQSSETGNPVGDDMDKLLDGLFGGTRSKVKPATGEPEPPNREL